MKVANITGYILFVLLVLHSCKETPQKTIKTEPIVFKKEGELSIFKKQSDTLITTFDIEIAESEYETQTGLMYRDHMENNQGMLFIFPDERLHSFYMKNTAIPLDLVYIKADSTIASFQENAQPFDESGLPSKVPVQYVLEINAGLVNTLGLQLGDKIDFVKN